MNPNRNDAVVRIYVFQRRFLQQKEIGNFPRLDGSNLRIEFEFSCVTDRGRSEDLWERQTGLLHLLHLQIAVQSGQIPVGRSGGSVRAQEEVSVSRRQISNDLPNAPEGAAVESFEDGLIRGSVFRDFFLEPFAWR